MIKKLFLSHTTNQFFLWRCWHVTCKDNQKSTGTMRVVEISQSGGPEVLKPSQRDDLVVPQAGSGEVLIKVIAAGVNRPDCLQRMGMYAPPPGTSDIPGLEVAGEIIGGDLSGPENALRGFKIGDQVCALVAGGGYAEYCVAPIVQCLPLPKGWTHIEAAGLPETFFTVWSNLFDRAQLTTPSSPHHRKQCVLVHGGSSGIGVTAIQLAKAMGHDVIVTVGSEEKASACLAIGAVHAINYKATDFVAEVNAFTNGQGVDVVLDMVGGEYVGRDINCLKDEGRLVCIAVQGGKIANNIDVSLIMQKRLTISGSTLRPRPVTFKGATASSLLQHVWPFLENGDIKPLVFKTFPLEEASGAHALMESGQHVGKIILTV